jgi:hypothetical protein
MSVHKSKRGGQALVEMAFIIPFLLLVIANVVNFGGMFYAAITVANAARHASENFIYGSATIRNALPGNPDQVWTQAQQEMATLPNQPSIVIRLCYENRASPGNPTCSTRGPGSAAFSVPPIDTRAEGFAYQVAWADIGYTYVPYIPLFDVPVMGVSLSPPPRAMVRQSVMRVLN